MVLEAPPISFGAIKMEPPITPSSSTEMDSSLLMSSSDELESSSTLASSSSFKMKTPLPKKKVGVGNKACPDCGKTYTQWGSLKRHQTYECGKPKRFGCSYCHFRSKHKHNVRTHVMLRHPGFKFNFTEYNG